MWMSLVTMTFSIVVETSPNSDELKRQWEEKKWKQQVLIIPKRSFTAKGKRGLGQQLARDVEQKNGVSKMGELPCLHIDGENPVIRKKLM